MKKLSAYEIALSAFACALATIFLTVGMYSEILLFTGYLFGGVALMLPLSKKCYTGYILAYIGTCVLSFIFTSGRIFDILPFVIFFGLHPLINELQLKSKINCWLACGLKALWFDATMLFIWKFLFLETSTLPIVDKYIIPIVLILGTAFFIFYDSTMYKCRYSVYTLVKRFDNKKR